MFDAMVFDVVVRNWISDDCDDEIILDVVYAVAFICLIILFEVVATDELIWFDVDERN